MNNIEIIHKGNRITISIPKYEKLENVLQELKKKERLLKIKEIFDEK